MRSGKRPERRILVVVRHPLGGVRYAHPLHLSDAHGGRLPFHLRDSRRPVHARIPRRRGPLGRRGDCSTSLAASPIAFAARFFPAVRAVLKRRDFDSDPLARASRRHSRHVRCHVGTRTAARHDLARRLLPRGDFRDPRLAPIRALEQLLRRLDVLIAVGEDARDDHLRHLPALGNGPCRVHVIPNGIDLARYEPRDPTGDLRRELGLAGDVSLLGIPGQVHAPKRLFAADRSLVDCCPRSARPRFHLLAVGSGDFVREYKADVERHDELRGRVTFREHVSDPAPILRELDLLVMPSLWEACPLLPMEALVCGVPVLGSDCIGLREVLRGSPARTAPANDPLALAKALGDALARPWKESAVAWIPAARQRFDVRQRAEELLAVFDSCVRLRAGTRRLTVEPMLSGEDRP